MAEFIRWFQDPPGAALSAEYKVDNFTIPAGGVPVGHRLFVAIAAKQSTTLVLAPTITRAGSPVVGNTWVLQFAKINTDVNSDPLAMACYSLHVAVPLEAGDVVDMGYTAGAKHTLISMEFAGLQRSAVPGGVDTDAYTVLGPDSAPYVHGDFGPLSVSGARLLLGAVAMTVVGETDTVGAPETEFRPTLPAGMTRGSCYHSDLDIITYPTRIGITMTYQFVSAGTYLMEGDYFPNASRVGNNINFAGGIISTRLLADYGDLAQTQNGWLFQVRNDG